MRVIVTRARRDRVEHLAVTAPDGATVGDLRRHVDGPAFTGEPEERGSLPLEHGSDLDDGGRSPGEAAGLPRLVVTTGPDAGGTAALPPGRWVTIGRDPRCDLTIADPGLSRRHLRVRQDRDGVRVEDLASTNGLAWESDTRQPSGTWPVGDRLLIGGSGVVLVPRPPAPARQVSGGGVREVVPWPRSARAVPTRELATPAAAARRRVRPPSAWTWSLPLVVALAVALLLRMPWLLLFGLLGPAMVLGHFLGDRRAARLEHEEALVEHARVRRKNEHRARRYLAEELMLLRDRHPCLVGVTTSLVPHPSTSLWECSAEDLEVCLGEYACPSSVRLEDEALWHDAAPLPLTLAGPLVVCGARALREAFTRSLVLQLATRHPPTQWTLLLDPARAPRAAWDLLGWLPQTSTSGSTPDGRTLRWGEDLLLVDDVTQAPAGATRIVLTSGTRAVLQVPGQDEVTFTPTTLGLARARALGHALAPLRARDAVDGDPDAPALPGGSPPLGELAGWPDSVEDALATWAGHTPGLAVDLGHDAAGRPVTIDLVRDGPHALVAGTTGAGKSELLRSLVVGLALRRSPGDLALLLVDFKGGSSLGDCALLPHVTGMVTDLDPHLAGRVLASLRAELTRREGVVAAAGVKDAAEVPGLPRLVVVIDEFRVLAEEVPEVMGGLIRLAAVGRSLGVHLVLATQRPAGVVGPDLRANVNLRIALRLRDSADSHDVIETAQAALLPEGRPGLALWRTGADLPRAVQVARVGPPRRRSSSGWDVQVVPDIWSARRVLDRPAEAEAEADDLGALATTLREAAEQADLHPPVVWHPPLPEELGTLSGEPRAWALADVPSRQAREALTWVGDHHVGLVGAARSGRTTALRSLLSRADGAWVVVLDLGRGLEGTESAEHPGLVGWVQPDDLAHGIRVLDRLEGVVRARQSAGAGAEHVPVVLVLDGWDRFVDLFEPVERGRAVDVALRVLREGPAVGVVALLSGDRSLLLGKVASTLPSTWALRLNDPSDLLMTGLRPHQLPTTQPPGRLVSMRDGTEAHLVLPSAGQPVSPAGHPPLVCRALPRRWSAGSGQWAVGGDEAAPVPRPAGSVLVIGPPGSGRTHALARLRDGRPAVVVDPASPPEVDEVSRACAGLGTGGLLVVDDAHLLAGSPLEDALVEVATAHRMELLVAADAEAATGAFRGLVPQAARARTGVVLQPGSASHGAVLGVSVPVGDLPLPGRGVLVHRGRCTRVQVAAPHG
ncbi:FtsK/SpoIIIE domain-containing protein [Serinicoccus marinus]|uniref:FtsK/SpoIIIE domain-containing protein n=1 Tax=Serinicoccus marinus TaxID=247333 RepID=UPI002493108B|nr:FtsK/SpoIIIE domain-containing protein [Serinicoccus marinus]